MSEGRSLKRLVQLVVIDNNYPLLSKVYLQSGMSMAFNLGEFTASPGKDIYLTPDGLCRSFSKDEKKENFGFIQKINFYFINHTNNKGNWNLKNSSFPGRLYEKFTDLEDKQSLKEFMKNKEFDGGYNFSIFPNQSEIKQLKKKYQEAKNSEFSNYCIAHKIIFCIEDNAVSAHMKDGKKEQLEINELIGKAIKEINIAFIWKKQQQMNNFIIRYQTGKLQENNILWLNEQLENVSEVLMSNKSYLWEKIEKGTMNDVNGWNPRSDGENDIRNAPLVPVFRIYGHYALCCLEIFTEMQEEFRYFVCKRCQKLVFAGKKSKRKFCSKDDNKECFMKQQNTRKRKSYKKKKKLKEEEII